jgi:DNA-binding NtrC family response regulator
MPVTKGTILAITENSEMCALLEDLLSKEGYSVESVHDGELTLKQWDEKRVVCLYDLLIFDLRMEEISLPEWNRRIIAIHPQQTIITLTPIEMLASAIEAKKGGAFDYVIVPFKTDDLLAVVQKGFDRIRLQKEVTRLREEVSKEYRFSNIIGKSKEMRAIFQLIRRVAESTVNILISGESGTGKEIVAKAIHYNSPRRDYPFIAVNCAAIPETLLESELFGHVRGAFTDARTDKKGMFEEAHGGTLLLDEIGETPVSLQSKLLRAIEEKAIRRVGSTKTVPVDIRIICATNQDLLEEVKAKRFRDDLYYRINVLEITLPPLRKRREDILLLAEHFLKKFADAQRKEIGAFTESAMNILLYYPWPGNVRELENAIERAVTLARSDRISAEDLPPAMTGRQEDQLLLDQMLSKAVPLADVEREYIQRVLQLVGGNKLRAAQILQIDRKTLYRKLAELHRQQAAEGQK